MLCLGTGHGRRHTAQHRLRAEERMAAPISSVHPADSASDDDGGNHGDAGDYDSILESAHNVLDLDSLSSPPEAALPAGKQLDDSWQEPTGAAGASFYGEGRLPQRRIKGGRKAGGRARVQARGPRCASTP